MKILSGNIPFRQAKNYRKGRVRPVQLIVLHSMEAPEKGNTAENVASYFAGSNAPMASAHYCVDADSILQCVRLEDTAYHCKNANANGIGIEHAGYAKQTLNEWLDEYGKEMLERSAELVASLCHQFNIPVRRARFVGKNNPQVIETGICGHVEVPQHGSHYDPGVGFPWTYYLERAEFYFGGSKPTVPGHETQFDAPTSEALPDTTNESLQAKAPTETSVTVTDGNVKVETSEGAKSQEKIAIEKPEPLNFSTTMRNKIATVTGGNLTLQAVRDYAEQARFLGLSMKFWFWVSIIALIGTGVYLLAAFYKHRSDVARDMEITNNLIASNSTPNNKIELVDKEKISLYENLGYKVVRR